MRFVKSILSLCCAAAALAFSVYAQGSTEPNSDTTPSRMMHARVLAATGNFSAAASELEAIRNDAKDNSVRGITRILLMDVYLRQGNYPRALNLLEESFKTRAGGDESSLHVYFALTGQMLNGIRARLDRYREFGLDTTDESLPAEARNDLDHIRQLLERAVEQAKGIREENVKSTESTALLEDAATVRLKLARGGRDRLRWQREIADARQRLAATQTRHARRRGDGGKVAVNRVPGASSLVSPAADKTAGSGPTPATTAPPNAPPTLEQSATPPTKTGTASSAVDAGTATTAPLKQPKNDSPPPPPHTTTKSGSSSGGGGGAPPAGQPGEASREPVPVGSLHDKARQKVSPSYPMAAKLGRITGIVTVYLVVNKDGSVERIERTSGPALLQQAAADAARRWKFHPTQIDGQPVRMTGFITFNFAL